MVRLAAAPAVLSSHVVASFLINTRRDGPLGKERCSLRRIRRNRVREIAYLGSQPLKERTMSIPVNVIERLPRVEGLLNYLAPMAEKPMNLTYDPPPGVAGSTGIPEPHVMPIHDARPVAGRLTLDGEGLALIEHCSAVKDFYDEDELRRVYYPEAIR